MAKQKQDDPKKSGNKPTTQNLAIIGSFVVIGLIIVICVGSYVVNYINSAPKREVLDVDTIYPNILINDIDVGGLTKENAIQQLEEDLEEPFEQNVMTFVVNGDEEINLTYAQFGVKYDIESAVEEAYQYAREGSIDERYELYDKLKIGEPHSFDATVLNKDTGELNDDVKNNIRTLLEKELKDKSYVAPAVVNGVTMKGQELDLDRLVDIVVDAIETNTGTGMSIHVPLKEIA